MTAVPNYDNCIIRYKNAKNRGSSYDLKQVTIATEKDTENITRLNIKPVTAPKSSSNWSSGANTSKIIDLQRIEKRITIHGSLVTGLSPSVAGAFDVTNNVYGSGDTYTESTNAIDKKADLKGIFDAGGTCWITYEGQTFSALLEKLEINGENKHGSEPADGEVGFSVIFTAVKGADM